IHALLARVGFVASGIFVMDAGKRDSRLNAYFGGLGKVKRVVLFDTLLSKTTSAQLLAILGHELGHFKHHDIYKSLAFAMCAIAAVFFAASQMPETFYAPILPVAPNIVLVLYLCVEIVGFWAMPLMGMMSRHNEYAADAFGAELQGAENLASALCVLAKENRSFPHAHPLQIFFYHTHPPLLQRLLALGVPQSALVCDESHPL
ncbi:MAG: M48 family metalloprotease, partial [Helicobacter sp.]|nr:M48 family metalloprotease [Helicobacter sp.]